MTESELLANDKKHQQWLKDNPPTQKRIDELIMELNDANHSIYLLSKRIEELEEILKNK